MYEQVCDILFESKDKKTHNKPESIKHDFYRLSRVNVEMLSKEDLINFERELVAVNQEFEKVVRNRKEDNELRAKVFRELMARVAVSFIELESKSTNEPTLEEELTQQDLVDNLTEQVIKGFVESIGLDLGSVRIYKVGSKDERKPSRREQRIKEIISDLEISREALERVLLDSNIVTQQITEVQMLLGCVDLKELAYYEEKYSNLEEKNLLEEAKKVKDELDNLIETFNSDIDSLKIKRF